jgi:carboxypeptidase Q
MVTSVSSCAGRWTMAVCLILLPFGQATAQVIDTDVIARIKAEGQDRSQALGVVGWLSDVYGPRLTGAPSTEIAKEWTLGTLRGYGLSNVHEERFPFGTGWSLERFHAHMTKPQVMPIIGHPQAWTTSTTGTVRADVVRVDIRHSDDFARYRGRLRGKIVLPQQTREVAMLEGDLVLRMDERLLRQASRPQVPSGSSQSGDTEGGPTLADLTREFFLEEGVVAVLDRGSDSFMVSGAPSGSNLDWPTQRTDGGTVFLAGGGPRADQVGRVVPTATIAVEHYNRMVRNLERGVAVEAEINIQTTFHDEEETLNAFNIVAEIPGTTDLAHEVVILGAHFDSTHASTGATDNATGVAAMMEAMRVLRAVGARPRRTIRLVLWGAEEQGLLGSRDYVARHYADPDTLERRPDYDNLSAYYNLDNGAGRVRGIWLQDNTRVAPIFEPWLKALDELGVTTLGRRATRGTDHLSFDEVGLPGFQFMQDRLEYNSRTHHSNMDFMDRVQEEDLVQMSVVAAVFAYNTAMLDERLPRKLVPMAFRSQQQER